jgi:beta-galactosidase
LWRLVEENSHVLGDFTWTGWDYLGETGIGWTKYPDEGSAPSGVLAPFPALTAGCGDIDITGHRRPVSYYRETVYGLRHVPYLAVHRPEFHGQPTSQTPWSWADAVSSWSFDVPVGSPITIDVYSDADEVELTVDGTPIGRATVGEEKACLTRFQSTYQPGELTAIAYRAGAETGRTTLVTAGDSLELAVAADRTQIRADDTDLAYVTIKLQDQDGNLANHQDRQIDVQVSGPGVLAGLGSGRTSTEERFDASSCSSFDGRALAIIRPTAAGDIRVQVSAHGCDPAAVTLQAERR